MWMELSPLSLGGFHTHLGIWHTWAESDELYELRGRPRIYERSVHSELISLEFMAMKLSKQHDLLLLLFEAMLFPQAPNRFTLAGSSSHSSEAPYC